jgi:hypothetical protein
MKEINKRLDATSLLMRSWKYRKRTPFAEVMFARLYISLRPFSSHERLTDNEKSEEIFE